MTDLKSASQDLKMEATKYNDSNNNETGGDIAIDDEIDEPRHRRLEFLLKQTEIFGHFVTNGTKPKSNIIKNSQEISNKSRKMRHNDNENNNDEAYKFDCTPNYIKGEMRDYQIQGLNWLILLYENGINGILADEMGLGKTLQSISMLGYLKHMKKCKGHFLVVVPKSTLMNWFNECSRWCPTLKPVLLIGNMLERKQIITESLEPRQWDVCITSFEVAILEKSNLTKFKWDYVIIDEAQRIKNEKTITWRTLSSIRSANRLLLTGTPLQNNLHELWALLNYLLPDVFNSSEDFDKWFNADNCLGNQSLINRLHAILKPFVLRRIKSEVEKKLLPKKEVKIYVGLSQMQRELYKKILLKELKTINNFGEETKTSLNYVLQHLRKCSGHPYLFEGFEPGPPYKTDMNLVNNSGKLSVLDKLLPRLKQQGSRVLIFVQFIGMMDILDEYCSWRGYNFVRLSGENKHEERSELVDQFNAPNSKLFIFLLSTRAGGLGINLATADVVIFYDSDWNPQVDLQATDRAHRIGQKKQVRIFRLITENTVDEIIDMRAGEKLHLDKCVIQDGFNKVKDKSNTLLSILRFNTNQFFSSKDTQLTDADIDALLERGEDKNGELVEIYKNNNKRDNKVSVYDFVGDVKETKNKKSVEHVEQIYDFQFFPLELHALMQLDNLTVKQKNRKLKMLGGGFGDWTQTDFKQFVDAYMKYGLNDDENIIKSVESKTPWEVLQYKNVFWKRYHEVRGIHDKMKQIIKMTGGEEQHNEKEALVVNDRQQEDRLRIQKLLKAKMNACAQDPLKSLEIHYEINENDSNNSRGFSIELDRFLICKLCQIGYEKTDVYELLESKIQKTRSFHSKSFIKLCTTSELKKRCEMLIKLIENEKPNIASGAKQSKRPKLSTLN